MNIPIVPSSQLPEVLLGSIPLPAYNPSFFDKVETFFGGDRARPPLLTDHCWILLKEIHFYERVGMGGIALGLLCSAAIVVSAIAMIYFGHLIVNVTIILLASLLFLKLNPEIRHVSDHLVSLKNDFRADFTIEAYQQFFAQCLDHNTPVDRDLWNERLEEISKFYRVDYLIGSEGLELLREIMVKGEKRLPLLAYTLTEGTLYLYLIIQAFYANEEGSEAAYAGRALLKNCLNITTSDYIDVARALNRIYEQRLATLVDEDRKEAKKLVLREIEEMGNYFTPLSDALPFRERFLSFLVSRDDPRSISYFKTFCYLANNRLKEFIELNHDEQISLLTQIAYNRLAPPIPEASLLIHQLKQFPLREVDNILREKLLKERIDPRVLAALLKGATKHALPHVHIHFHFNNRERYLEISDSPSLNEHFWLLYLLELPNVGEALEGLLTETELRLLRGFSSALAEVDEREGSSGLITLNIILEEPSFNRFLEDKRARDFFIELHPEWLETRLKAGDLSLLTEEAKVDLFPLLPPEEKRKILASLSGDQKREILKTQLTFAEETDTIKVMLPILSREGLSNLTHNLETAAERQQQLHQKAQWIIQEALNSLPPFHFAVAIHELGLQTDFEEWADALPPLHAKAVGGLSLS